MRKGIPPRIFYHQPQGKPIFSTAQVKRRKPVRRHTGRSTIVSGSAFPSPPRERSLSLLPTNFSVWRQGRWRCGKRRAPPPARCASACWNLSSSRRSPTSCRNTTHSKYPGVTIEIKSATDAALYRMLRQNELDIIYLLDNVVYHKDCVRACTSPISLKFIADRKMNCAAGKISLLRRLRKNP